MLGILDTLPASKHLVKEKYKNLNKEFNKSYFLVRNDKTKKLKILEGEVTNLYKEKFDVYPSLVISWGKYYRTKEYSISLQIDFRIAEP